MDKENEDFNTAEQPTPEKQQDTTSRVDESVDVEPTESVQAEPAEVELEHLLDAGNEESSQEIEQPTGVGVEPQIASSEPDVEPRSMPLEPTNAGDVEPKKAPKNKLVFVVVALVLALVIAIGVFGYVLLSSTDKTDSSLSSESANSTVSLQGAAITGIEGTVEYNLGSGWNAATAKTEITEATQLRTLANSRAVITLDDGSAIRLDSDSVVTLTKLANDEVIVKNEAGQIYTRVSPSESRQFVVVVGEEEFKALGTAYRTVNETEQKGVEVFHSKVEAKTVKQEKLELSEGQAFYSKHTDAKKVDKLVKLDLEDLKDDAFVQWNYEKDSDEKEYKDRLGFIKDLNRPAKEEPSQTQPQPAATEPEAVRGISAWAEKTDSGIKVSWSANGVNTSNGFKVAYSHDDSTPSYGENSAQYVGSGNYSTSLKLVDGKKWFIRVCTYRDDGKCDNYSNSLAVTAPYQKKEESLEKVTRGTISAILDGTKLKWSYSGTAPHGYKVVWSTSPNPTYPGSDAKYTTATSYDLADKLGDKKGKYSVRVCAYTAGTISSQCVDYSGNVSY